MPALSDREWDLLEYLVDGYRTSTIAEEIGWTTTSVSRYFLRMRKKLQAKSSAHILIRAIEVELLVLLDGTVQRNPATLGSGRSPRA